MFRPRIDAGGARMRAADAAAGRETQMTRMLKDMTARQAARQRIIDAAGRLPVMNSLSELAHGELPLFPALRLKEDAALNDVLGAMKRESNVPIIKARRDKETSVGAHFDGYYAGYNPWTLHHNLEGSATLRVSFLGAELFTQYVELADRIDDETEAGQQLLAANRAAFGEYRMSTAENVFTADIAPGSRTLIWNGLPPKILLRKPAPGQPQRRVNEAATPAVHDFQRSEPGSYEIYASPKQPLEVLPEGFEAIE